MCQHLITQLRGCLWLNLYCTRGHASARFILDAVHTVQVQVQVLQTPGSSSALTCRCRETRANAATATPTPIIAARDAPSITGARSPTTASSNLRSAMFIGRVMTLVINGTGCFVPVPDSLYASELCHDAGISPSGRHSP